MKPTFDLFQLGLAISAIEAQRAGFPNMAEAFAKALRRDMGVAEATPEAPKACHSRETGGKRAFYCKTELPETTPSDFAAIERQRNEFVDRWETRFRNYNS